MGVFSFKFQSDSINTNGQEITEENQQTLNSNLILLILGIGTSALIHDML